MSLIGQLLRPRAAITSSHELLTELQRGSLSEAGVHVTPETALQLSAVFACTRVRAESLAQVPLVVMEEDGEVRRRAKDHPLHRLLSQAPNEWQTSFQFRETMETHLTLSGNFFALVTRVRGEIRELLPLLPGWVEVRQDARWALRYTIRIPGVAPFERGADTMLHVVGLTLNGYTGVNPLTYQREAIGAGLQQQRYASRLLSSGARPSGVLEYPKTLSKDARKRIGEEFDTLYSGAENSGKTMVLHDGMKYSALGMSAEDLQFLETRKFSRSEVASIYRVPLHMIGDLERSTNNNIEHQSLEFVKYTVTPETTRIEQAMDRQLLSRQDQGRYRVRFVLQGLERGDFKTRTEGYQRGIQSGWMSRAEARTLEDLPPGPDELNEFLKPLNMAAAGEREATTGGGGRDDA